MPLKKTVPRLLLTAVFIGWGIGRPEPLWMSSWWGLLPSSAMFLAFAAGLLGWGLLAEKRLGGGGATVYLSSSVAAVALAMLAGHAGLLGETGRWLFLSFLAAGVWAAPSFDREKLLLCFEARWETALFASVFLLRAFSAYLPQAHGDPLLYHLMAPRLWNLRGAVHLEPDLPIPLLASTWEYFFLWPQALLATPGSSLAELIHAQVFSQWIHLLWGLYGAAFVLRALWRKLPRNVLGRGAELPMLLAMLFVSSMQWTAPLAKNDCGIAFWCLGAWLLAQAGLERRQASAWLAAGLLSGLAVAGKISAILFLIPLGALYLFLLARQARPGFAKVLAAAAAGFALGAFPIYLRNWLETGNPFYTMFSHWFPSYWVSRSWADHFSAHQPTETHLAQMFLFRARQLAHESPTFWLLPALLPLLLVPRTRAAFRPWSEWAALFLLSVLLCLVAVGENAEVRYLGASLWLGAALGAVAFLLVLHELPARLAPAGRLLLVAGLLASSKLPTHLLWKFPGIPPGEATVLRHTAGAAKAWLRAHVPPGRLVLLYGDNETYYLSGLRVAVLTERPDIDAATYGKTDLRDFFRGLCGSSGASFLLDARAEHGLRRRFPAGPWDAAVLFDQGSARVYDLSLLERLVLGSEEKKCGRF